MKYDWRWHALACALSGLTPIAVSIVELHDVRAWQWLVFAASLVVMNAGEYALHRGPFHTPFPVRALYHRHTTLHHAQFDHRNMALASARDLEFILLPWWGFAASLAITSPVIALLYWAQPNLGWLFVLAQSLYYVVYEILHTASHLPSRSRFVQAVSQHHRVHHDPRLMRRYNFNFALPLFDVVFGTRYREHAVSRRWSSRSAGWEPTPGDSADRRR